ncbi:MAG: hypothetical protein ACE5NP_04510 [Anaerolineae bacterium]
MGAAAWRGNGKAMVQGTDLSLRILRLEQKLESYQKLHAGKLDEIGLTLAELKRQVLHMATLQQQAAPQTRPLRCSSDKSS